MSKKYKIDTLGCRTNQYESQAFVDQLRAVGYREVAEGEEADICIVNTCTVTDSADKRSLHTIRRLEKEHPEAEVYVTGCMAERRKEELLRVSERVRVVPNAEKETLLSIALPSEALPEFSIQRFDDHTRAFIKIQDGCNSFCSYCIIPYVRGRSRSKSMESVLKEIKSVVANGYKEIVLTGINIGDFDGGKGKGEAPDRLADLVRAVDEIEGLERIRISSIDPDEVDEDLLQAVTAGKKTCASMHVVLQAGSNKVLKRMNRKYTREEFFQAVERLRAANPDFTFTTDVIVGFPGETEEDFQETLDAIEEVRFAKVHMFPYSVRPGTRAARFTDTLSPEVISERKQRLLRAAEKAAFALREQYVGKRVTVLFESPDSEMPGYIRGHTDNFLEVTVLANGLSRNDIAEVLITENTPLGLKGEVCQFASL